MKRKFIIIGLEDCPRPSLSDEIGHLLASGTVFSGGIRHYEIIKELLPSCHEWIPITIPLDRLWPEYDHYFTLHEQPLIIFASGDPLFFGFANTLLRIWPDAELTIFPWFNSLQMLAHRIPLRYDDMQITSLTGRPWKGLDEVIIRRCSKIGVLTDRVHTPAAIAARLLEYGYTEYVMYVGEHLGHPQLERVRRFTLSEAVSEIFDCPNCVILQALEQRCRLWGIPDEAFEHLDGRSRMITKMPIRLLSLQAMDLPLRHVMWDVGFCTGSISIEAKLQFPHLTVCSFEIREACRNLMHINSRRFGALDLEPMIGDFLEVNLEEIPAPDAVFIGGHGGQLKSILHRIQKRLRKGGCVVFNAVSDESRQLFEEGVCECGWSILSTHRVVIDDYNPITILKAGNADCSISDSLVKGGVK